MKYYAKSFLIVGLMSIISATSQAAENNDRRGDKGGQGKGRPQFSTLDLNADGDISFDEFSSHDIPHGDHETVFNNIDADQNGVISEQEFTDHKPPHGKKPKGQR
ncbi:EF-hand domain-containing protein [Psychrosphaera sp. B3R10]|uniref:EF-hand domain-containing protein n=1 Tax=unclassified Psychrosphaera TaxID=2641570 RepID=UPI001C08E901|nr:MULTISPECIES: EF-hand domain-containing protein [unclassified Psychrosphaera]MBU2881725.1 EF-hand domain-containing protein [Psychrosphaera sp. I2R16]MBU2990090.1 EF-hand domain-containing protein [Psychrosphaera sp. B3R10]